MLETLVHLDKSVEGLDIFIAYTVSWRISSRFNYNFYPFELEIQDLVNYVKNRYSLDTLKNDSIVRAYRDFFWRIGVDPTKVRPSSEALIRRILRNVFPKINPIVDAGNISSAYTMVPIGMYDLERCTPPLTLRLSRGDEVFRPLGGVEERLREGIPILVDAKGSVMHVYPYRDSIDTAIQSETHRAIIIAAGVRGVDRERVRRAVDLTVKLLTKIEWSWCNNIVVKP